MSVNPQMGAPPPKKPISPVAIILIVVASIIVLGGILMVAGGLFLVHKAKQAGIDPDLMQRNPALAVTKMIAAVNPDVEVVRVDEGSGKITLREKKTGKVVTLDFEKVKQGQITFEGDGEKVTVEGSAEGEEGSVRIKGPEGTYQFGSGPGKLPSWAPVYPGSAQKTAGFSRTPEGEGSTVHLTTGDSVEQVMEFYKDRLESGGFQVNTVLHGGASTGAVVTAQSGDEKRNATLMIGRQDEVTTIGGSFFEKK